MARKKSEAAGTPEANEPGEQGVIFQELDDSAESKAIMKEAKKLAKIRADRAELLGTSKENERESEKRLAEKLHAAGIPRFSHKGIKVELIERSEKVTVKLDTEDDESGEDDDA